MTLTDHFSLEEFLPAGIVAADVPPDVVENLMLLCKHVLEPVRARFGVPVVIHSGWRPPAKNAAIGGVPHSDHLTGKAADFHVADTPTAPWVENTLQAARYIREQLSGEFGQIIVEDHRAHYGDPGKLWVHVALPSAKHPGDGSDPNALLLSHTPQQYQAWRDDVA